MRKILFALALLVPFTATAQTTSTTTAENCATNKLVYKAIPRDLGAGETMWLYSPQGQTNYIGGISVVTFKTAEEATGVLADIRKNYAGTYLSIRCEKTAQK